MSREEVEELIERWPLIKLFDLPPESVVVEVGTYTGGTLEALDSLYHPSYMVGYEPQPWAAHQAADRLAGRSNCTIIEQGLLAEHMVDGYSRAYEIGEWHTDGASIVNTGPGARNHGVGQFVDANYALGLIKKRPIDLLCMNIEGFEFKLIPYLRECGWLEGSITRLAVQWHLGLGAHPASYDDIADEIDRLGQDGYELVYDERPAWTYHTRRSRA